ncbi:MAG: L,D-transpeptidase family protein [Rhodospirillales bacterium]|nr:L,D-transpeptidase family protein [Rhodospirillales bacterium]
MTSLSKLSLTGKPRPVPARLAGLGAAVCLLVASGGTWADDVVGDLRVYAATHEDTLLDIARDNQLGFIEVMAANPGVDAWLPGSGTRVILPTAHVLPDAPRTGIVINLAELRLYYFGRGDAPVVTLPIGVGREGFQTPVGTTKVVRKQAGPTWRPTAATRADDPQLPAVVPPGPDNPLGKFALYLGWPAYLIHGTAEGAKEWGIGRRVSRGCIRMYPEAIEWLFNRVPVGTQVRTVQEMVKLGRRDGDLYMEVNPSYTQVDQIEERGFADPEPVPEQIDPDRILLAADQDIGRLDWDAVAWALNQRDGMPVRITR